MDAEIIDLVVIAGACKPLAAWWQQFSVTGDASPSELDRARKQLATLAPIPGRVGRAINQIVSAESQTTSGQVRAALELVARTAACISGPLPANSQATAPTPKKRRRTGDERSQPALPGFE